MEFVDNGKNRNSTDSGAKCSLSSDRGGLTHPVSLTAAEKCLVKLQSASETRAERSSVFRVSTRGVQQQQEIMMGRNDPSRPFYTYLSVIVIQRRLL